MKHNFALLAPSSFIRLAFDEKLFAFVLLLRLLSCLLSLLAFCPRRVAPSYICTRGGAIFVAT